MACPPPRAETSPDLPLRWVGARRVWLVGSTATRSDRPVPAPRSRSRDTRARHRPRPSPGVRKGSTLPPDPYRERPIPAGMGTRRGEVADAVSDQHRKEAEPVPGRRASSPQGAHVEAQEAGRARAAASSDSGPPPRRPQAQPRLRARTVACALRSDGSRTPRSRRRTERTRTQDRYPGVTQVERAIRHAREQQQHRQPRSRRSRTRSADTAARRIAPAAPARRHRDDAAADPSPQPTRRFPQAAPHRHPSRSTRPAGCSRATARGRSTGTRSRSSDRIRAPARPPPASTTGSCGRSPRATFPGGANHTISPIEIAPMIATPNPRQPLDGFLRFGASSAQSGSI